MSTQDQTEHMLLRFRITIKDFFAEKMVSPELRASSSWNRFMRILGSQQQAGGISPKSDVLLFFHGTFSSRPSPSCAPQQQQMDLPLNRCTGGRYALAVPLLTPRRELLVEQAMRVRARPSGALEFEGMLQN